MQQHIGVRVPEKSLFVWDQNAAEVKLPAGYQAVNVVAFPNMKCHLCLSPVSPIGALRVFAVPAFGDRFRDQRVIRRRDFKV